MIMDPNTSSSTSTTAVATMSSDSTVALSVDRHQQQSLAEMNQEQRVLIADPSDGTVNRATSSCHAAADDTPLHRRRPDSITASRRASRNRSRRMMLAHTLSPLLLLIGLASVVAQKIDGECSCSPRQFVFKLNLSAGCPALPPPFPPNDVFQGGVKDYTCTIGPEPIPQAPQSVTSEDGDVALVIPDVDGDEPARRMEGSGSGVGIVYNNTAADYFPELEEIDIEELEWSSANITTSSVTISDEDVEPVSIYSIQFLEVDTEFNVINQDSAYVRNVDFMSGDVFNYTSIYVQDPGSDVIPGGMNMVLRGVNADGEPVRNVFTITYTNDCGVQTFEEGDAIGWVVFENFEPASEETCGAPPSAPPSPSITSKPSTTSPTGKRTPSPTKKYRTPRPTRRPSASGWNPQPQPQPDYMFSKSSKSGSKTSKGSKSSSSKSSKSKSSKSYGKSTDDGSSSWSHGYAPSNGYASRRQPTVDNGPIRGRDLRAADAASSTDTLIEEIEFDRYFLLDSNNDQKDKEKEVRQQTQRHLRR